MTDAKLNYLGPTTKLLIHERPKQPWWRKLPVGFLGIVVAPTTIAAAYYLFIASPVYVSEARFLVRATGQAQPTALGVALQGVGLSTGATDAYVVHEYIDSRDGLRELSQKMNVADMIGLKGVDVFSKYPRFWEQRSDEGLFKGFRRFVTVGYDATNGISTLRVKAFRARDAQAMSLALLDGGERLINRLNARATANALAEATVSQELARAKLSGAQQQLTAFRNREQFISPQVAATEGVQLIGGLLSTVANLRAERAQLSAEAPNSPQLPVLDSRIRAYEGQIAAEREKIAGSSNSIAPKLSAYEDLMSNRELAERELTQATAALVGAEQEARRQKLYLERVVAPNLPDSPAEPKRWLAILTVFASTMLAYGVGWLIWAGVREHRQV